MEWIIVAFAIALLAWGILIYNRLVRWKNQVLEAWSGIDVQLKRRHSLIPNLVAAVKAYGAYEEDLMTRLTDLRGHAGLDTVVERGRAETGLSTGIRRLVAVMEDYPDLKASETYLKLMGGLTEAEQHIQYARRYYNGAVRELNVLIQSFPSNLVAGLFRFRPAEYFEVELASERDAPPMELA